MAPEQLEGKDTDGRTDIFAFGAVLFEMLTGKKAFEGSSPASLIASILEHDPAPVSSLQPLVPPSIDRVVQACLAKDPDDRWQTARDLIRELNWIADAGTATTSTTALPRAHRRERIAWISTAVAMLAVIVLGIVMSGRAVPDLPVTRLDVVTPPTSDPFAFALSPDGRQLVFAATEETGARLWRRSLDQATAQPLTGTDGARAPFWAPDGRAIGFFAGGKLKRLDLDGGLPQVLAAAPRWAGAGRGAATESSYLRPRRPVPVQHRGVRRSGGCDHPARADTPCELSVAANAARWPRHVFRVRRGALSPQGCTSLRSAAEPRRVSSQQKPPRRTRLLVTCCSWIRDASSLAASTSKPRKAGPNRPASGDRFGDMAGRVLRLHDRCAGSSHDDRRAAAARLGGP
jgi:hypothetical protein